MTQKDKTLNCLNCRIGDFKYNLCDCHNGFCAKYKGIGTQEDFFMAIEALEVKPAHGRLIDADALMEYCANQKTKTINNNDIARFPTVQVDIPMWDTCFACPLSNCCPKIQGATNEDAQKYASEVPEGCPIDRPHGEWIDKGESDRLLKESDVMSIAFQLPYVVNSAFFDAVKALPSANRPTGEVDRQR